MRPNTALPSSTHATATMRANRGSDTGPEIALRSALHREGLRFRKNYRLDFDEGRARPDVVFPAARLAVFVDGCYWHGCRDHRSLPQRNVEFWKAKIDGTRRRDDTQNRLLAGAGWRVIRIWEHEAVDDAVARVQRALGEARRERSMSASASWRV